MGETNRGICAGESMIGLTNWPTFDIALPNSGNRSASRRLNAETSSRASVASDHRHMDRPSGNGKNEDSRGIRSSPKRGNWSSRMIQGLSRLTT